MEGERSERMYKIEQLIKYRYYAELIKKMGLNNITDSLTGLILRPYMLGFARKLMEEKIPFSFMMLDLDNFKFVNDTYGHSAGDGVLKGVSAALMEYMDGYGVVGRFGGDEILIIDLKHITYDEKKAFINEMYTGEKVLRINYRLKGCSPFVTGTIGCATYPDDATDFDELFSKIDKTLYRGKTKGRNCYIIYVEEKHKNIEIKKMARHGICKVMQSMIRQVELVPGANNKFHSVLPLLMDEIRISDLYYINKHNKMHAVLNSDFCENVPDIGRVMKDDIYHTNDISTLEEITPMFFDVLKKHSIETVLIVRMGMQQETDGYIVCAEPRSRRIWQEDECAMIYLLAKLISVGIRLDGHELPED